MENFTPGSALLGGALIGIATAWLMLANGRIAGVSGVLGGILRAPASDRAWRAAFLLGLVAGPLVLRAGGWQPPEITVQAGIPGLVAAGLLVGFGTRLGSGCTSGHGVCGFSRLSSRSIVATCAFMASGMITVFVVRHLLGD